MNQNEGLSDVYSLYNLCRYIFVRIEYEYNNIIEESGITLPQLRVLWIIKSFPGISLGEIAKIGYWAKPTVTKMLRLLMEKELVIKESYENRKLYRLQVTQKGDSFIQINKQSHNEKFPLWKLYSNFTEEEISYITATLQSFTISDENKILLDYIEKLNKNGLKIDYEFLTSKETSEFKELVRFYNILRVFILKVEAEHRNYLVKYNLTYPQLRALWVIEAFPGVTSSQLGEISCWAQSTANVIVKNLTYKELIYKEKSQLKNYLYLHINEKGEKLILEDFKENISKLDNFRQLSLIDKHKLNFICNLLYKMNEVLGNTKIRTYIERTCEVIKSR